MARGILAKALAGAGQGIAASAPSVMQIGLEQYRTQIMAERDARLQQYQTGERIAGQDFTAEQNRLRQEAETTRQKEGFSHAEKLADIAAGRAEALQEKLLAANSEKEKLSLLSDSMKTAQKELSETMASLENQPDNKVLLARQTTLMNELNSYRAMANRLVSGGKAGESGGSFKSLWSGGDSGEKQGGGTAITEKVNTDRAKGNQEPASMMFDRGAEPAAKPSVLPTVEPMPSAGKTTEKPAETAPPKTESAPSKKSDEDRLAELEALLSAPRMSVLEGGLIKQAREGRKFFGYAERKKLERERDMLRKKLGKE